MKFNFQNKLSSSHNTLCGTILNLQYRVECPTFGQYMQKNSTEVSLHLLMGQMQSIFWPKYQPGLHLVHFCVQGIPTWFVICDSRVKLKFANKYFSRN